MRKIMVVALIIIILTSLGVILSSHFKGGIEKEVIEEIPICRHVKLNSSLWIDPEFGWWVEIHNQYSVEVYDLTINLSGSKYVWDKQHQYQVLDRAEKKISLSFTLIPNEIKQLLISNIYDYMGGDDTDAFIFGCQNSNPQVYGWIRNG